MCSWEVSGTATYGEAAGHTSTEKTRSNAERTDPYTNAGVECSMVQRGARGPLARI